MKDEQTRKVVREGYARIAIQESSCCNPLKSCCGNASAEDISRNIGYTEEELKAVPKEKNGRKKKAIHF